MMTDEPWSRISLRIASQSRTLAEIEEVFGTRSSAPPGKSWAIDITTDSTKPLDEQLTDVKDYLREKVEAFESLSDVEINLSISWTPRTPQDGILFDLELISLLDRIGCYVLLDTICG